MRHASNPGHDQRSNTSWTPDPPVSTRHSPGVWWDGNQWYWGEGGYIAIGRWSGQTATWVDDPGFAGPARGGVPYYLGSIDQRGYFEYETIIRSIPSTGREAYISWGILIRYQSRSDWDLRAHVWNQERRWRPVQNSDFEASSRMLLSAGQLLPPLTGQYRYRR